VGDDNAAVAGLPGLGSATFINHREELTNFQVPFGWVRKLLCRNDLVDGRGDKTTINWGVSY
jgi:hypothetical protein